MKYIQYDRILKFHKSVFKKVGLDKETSNAVSLGLCETSLRGVDSHGIRLLPHYARSALSGRKNPRPNYIFKQVFPSFGYLDADNTFGHAAGIKAIDIAIPIAKTQGISVISVKNSSHPGAMATFALRAARQGFIALALTHADSLMSSYSGRRAYFGTNPICLAAPRKESEPFCLDMATTIISWNKLLNHREKNEKLFGEFATDKFGNQTNDPLNAESLQPIGGYKGFGLAAIVEILCGVLTGMPFGRSIPSMYESPMNKPRHLGQFYMVMRTDICQSQSVFESLLQKMTLEIRNEPSKNNEDMQLANDPQIKEARIRKKKGIPISNYLLKEFEKLSKELGLEMIF